MFRFFEMGGPIMYILLLCSVIVLAIFIERFIYLNKVSKKIDSLSKNLDAIPIDDLQSLSNKIKEHQKDDNILSKILYQIIDKKNISPESAKEASQREANKEIPKLEKYINSLGVIYNIAPMLGLLGTVIGLSVTLQDLVSTASLTPENLLNGIYMSLITTIAGLIVAIPTHIIHNYLTSKVNNIVHRLELNSSFYLEEILNAK